MNGIFMSGKRTNSSLGDVFKLVRSLCYAFLDYRVACLFHSR
jgi:hypothetical protein